MGKNSRLRRDARRRAQPRPQQTAPRATSPGETLTQADIIDLVGVASRYASVSARAADPKIAELADISAAATDDHLDPAVLVVDETILLVRNAWERGWQPLDLVHATRRRTSAPAAKWVARAVLVEAERAGAADRAPAAWLEQLRSLAPRGARPGGPGVLLATGGRATVAHWTAALVAREFIHRLPPSQLLVPPPSQWGTARRVARPSAPVGPEHAKTLTRVRALLAKAESTEFAAEAEAFTAKAQDIMARHAIDEALLADVSGASVGVDGTRVLIHHPYAAEKAGLLNVIAKTNRTRAVWNDFASCMTLVGVPTGLEQVEMLFTSMLVQATKAMTRAGQAPGGADRSSSFRKAFLTAYAMRIGERLTSSTDEAAASYGSDLVPVFARQAEAVDGEFERLFPHITTGSRRARYDARGWDAGTRAADAAVLPAGALDS